ncbi:MAG: hypothetical protein ACKVJQ_02035 [Alphaproteobacteria bacterium]
MADICQKLCFFLIGRIGAQDALCGFDDFQMLVLDLLFCTPNHDQQNDRNRDQRHANDGGILNPVSGKAMLGVENPKGYYEDDDARKDCKIPGQSEGGSGFQRGFIFHAVDACPNVMLIQKTNVTVGDKQPPKDQQR